MLEPLFLITNLLCRHLPKHEMKVESSGNKKISRKKLQKKYTEAHSEGKKTVSFHCFHFNRK